MKKCNCEVFRPKPTCQRAGAGEKPSKPIELKVYPTYENVDYFFNRVNSVPGDHVINSTWISQAYEELYPVRPRRHPPAHYEFRGARYWPHRSDVSKATAQLGYRPLKPDCMLPAAGGPDPPDGRVPRRRSGRPEPGVTWTPHLPPYKVPADKVPGLHPNLWCRRWGSSLDEDPFSYCPSCSCYTQPPVTDTSYLNLDRWTEICSHRNQPCYYNAYAKERPPMEGPLVQRPFPTPEELKVCQPPPNWWITFDRPVEIHPKPDYRLLPPRGAAPPCYSRFEINGVSSVKSQWIA